jgi:putative RNA 2'-phosphotransferase
MDFFYTRDMMEYKRLSKTIARALRHAPDEYGLELDAEGWVTVQDLLSALRKRQRAWANLSEDDLAAMIAQSDKRRYEILDGYIRALYGHSVPTKINKTPAEPPIVLYHGTGAADSILSEGLKPMRRQYAHLSIDEETALMVGRRKTSHPVILKIRAKEAHEAGILFYPGNESIWLADYIPPQFIERSGEK